MPFVLIIAGIVLLTAAVRNTQQQLFYLLALDFTGPHNFVFWVLSILVIGAIGYIPKAKPLSDGFLILVILVLFLKRGTGFFDMFQKQLALTQSSSPSKNPVLTDPITLGIPSQPGVTIGNTGSQTQPGAGLGGVTWGYPGNQSGGGLGLPGGECDPFWDPYCLQQNGTGFGGLLR